MQTQEINKLFITLFAIALTVILAIVFLFVKFYTRKNKMIQSKIQADLVYSLKQQQLELQALRSQMNPHFVFNAMNTIQFFINTNQNELAEVYITKLSHVIRKIFEFSTIGLINLSEEIEFLQNYLFIEKLRYEDKLEYSFYVSEDLKTDQIQVPSMLFQPLIENALIHGIFSKKNNGKIIIEFTKSDHYLITKIVDDGVGFLKHQSDNNTKSRISSGQLLEKRINLLNTKDNNYITYKIEERSHSTHDSGTTVEIKTKIKNHENHSHNS